MSDEWTTFNVKYFAIPMTALVFGLVIGFGLASSTNKQPTKKYPLQVHIVYETAGYYHTPIIECDSVKGDSLWKDGLKIVNKHIVSVEYK
jgi:hypothetical protein